MRKLEWLLVLALGTLLLQLAPSSASGVLDPRTWPRGVWIGLNIVILATLCRLEFGRTPSSSKTVPNKCSHVEVTMDRKGQKHEEYVARCRRDAEWRERAKKRLPFT